MVLSSISRIPGDFIPKIKKKNHKVKNTSDYLKIKNSVSLVVRNTVTIPQSYQNMQTENQEEKLDKTKLETKKQVKFLGSSGGEKDDPAYVSKIKI